MSFAKKTISLDGNSDTPNVQVSVRKNVPEKSIDMDVLSNSDVNIGLDLLVNPDKQKKGDATASPRTSYIPMDNPSSKGSIDMDKDDDDFDFNNILAKNSKSRENMDNLMSRMNIDNNSLDMKNLDDMDDMRSRNSRDNIDLVDDDKDYHEESRRDDSAPAKSYEDERKEREEILYQLEKMRRLGVQGIKRFNMSSDLDEMRYELNRIKKERSVEASIKFQRNAMMTFVTGVEYATDYFGLFAGNMKGWSENVYENINDYDEVFEELHEKYAHRGTVAPEIRLLWMLGGSAFMYHLSNSMFKSAPVGIEDILKQNPELMRQFANAAVNQMPPEQRQAASMMNQFAQNVPRNTPPPRQQSPLPPYAPRPVPNDTSSSDSQRSAPRNMGKTIPPPQGLDEILDDLKSSSTNNDTISEVISRTERSSKKRTLFQKPKSSSSSATLNL
jgi:hypothetical protein